MSRIYDNWERLVRATLRREQHRRRALRTPSDLSCRSPSFHSTLTFLSSPLRRQPLLATTDVFHQDSGYGRRFHLLLLSLVFPSLFSLLSLFSSLLLSLPLVYLCCTFAAGTVTRASQFQSFCCNSEGQSIITSKVSTTISEAERVVIPMVGVYDCWDRLVRATLRREQLRLYVERTPSDRSLASSSFSSSPNFMINSSRLSPRNFPSLLFMMKFEYAEILRATNYLSESNFIKHGRSGDLYRGFVKGNLVVIKRIDLSSAKKEQYYISELKVLDKLSDRGLVPLLGHCSENWKEKYLVYKYMPNRDLSSSFFSRVIYLKGFYPTWENRFRIARGIAEALYFLHHQCFPPLVHRDIQSSSILLDQGFEVRLCSLGDVCTEERKGKKIIQSLPEDTKQGPSDMSNDATCGYDVYCFGKVLLEMVTGELGVADDSSIKNELMNNNPLNFERIIATATADLHGQVGEKVRAMAMIAKGCLNPQPSWRPSMPYVLMALENEVGGMTKPTRRRLQARVNNLA